MDPIQCFTFYNVEYNVSRPDCLYFLQTALETILPQRQNGCTNMDVCLGCLVGRASETWGDMEVRVEEGLAKERVCQTTMRHPGTRRRGETWSRVPTTPRG
uniref:Uncharacterized protein n=1 Tax=Cacopsylla melanoneura TaxID=428564 RepID=A0A8D8R9S9_9HEMI